MYRYIFSLILCLGLSVTFSSAHTSVRYWPTGIQLGVDIARPLYYALYQKTGGQYELNAFADLTKLMLEGDLGWGNIRWDGFNRETNTRSTYTSSGRYFRIGLNYNIILDTPEKNVAFLGLRYAKSLFQDHLVSRVIYNSGELIKWGGFPVDKRQHAVRARWYEVVAGVKVRIWKPLYVGSTLRYKFLMRVEGADAYVPYDVLGWGLHSEETFGLSYYISLRIPFAGDIT